MYVFETADCYQQFALSKYFLNFLSLLKNLSVHKTLSREGHDLVHITVAHPEATKQHGILAIPINLPASIQPSSIKILYLSLKNQEKSSSALK